MNQKPIGGNNPKNHQSCQIRNQPDCMSTEATTITDSSGRSVQVQFSAPSKSVVYYEKKSKYLTAKYDKQMRSLIQKRLGVEDFVYDQLRILFGCVRDEDDHNCEIDLDKLLDIDSDFDRQKAIEVKIKAAVASPDVIDKFTETLLLKLKTL